MTQSIQAQANLPSPFRYDTTPQGEADVDPDQIAKLSDETAVSTGWGKDGFGFTDLLDIVNPLQHLPVISTLYRDLTGDEIAAAPKAIGGALYGGPIGLIAALGDAIVEAETGKDMAGAALALSRGASESGQPGKVSQVAALPTPIQPAVSGQLQASPATPSPAPGAAIPAEPPRAAPTNTAAVTTAPMANAEPSRVSTNSRWFSLVDQPARPPRPVSAAATQLYAEAKRPSPREEPIQTVSSHALDRLIARSQAAARAPARQPQETATGLANTPLPAGKMDVQQWMLQTLGKYENMQKP